MDACAVATELSQHVLDAALMRAKCGRCGVARFVAQMVCCVLCVGATRVAGLVWWHGLWVVLAALMARHGLCQT